MNVYEMLDTLSDLTLEKSKQRMGEHNYAYAFGMVVAELQADLDEMGLTKKQMKVLHDRITKLQLHVNQGRK
jgi:hypothetical protein